MSPLTAPCDDSGEMESDHVLKSTGKNDTTAPKVNLTGERTTDDAPCLKL